MAIDTSIQTNVQSPVSSKNYRVVVDSDGRLFCCYGKTSPSSLLVMAYSDDAGANWTEVTNTFPTLLVGISIAIDSTDKIHVVYRRDSYIVSYNTFDCGALTWGIAEDIFDGTSNTDAVDSITIAIDSSDFPHVAWSQDEPTTITNNIYYSNRSSGSWTARTNLIATGGSTSGLFPLIVIDSTDDIYVFFTFTDSDTYYAKYTGSWSSPNLIIAGSAGADTGSASAVIDSSDNVYVVIADTVLNVLAFVIYTKSTDSWSGESNISTDDVTYSTLGILSDNTVYLFYQNDTPATDGIYFRTYSGGAWSAESSIIITDPGTINSVASIYTPVFPILNGLKTQQPTVGYQLTYCLSASTSLIYLGSTGLTLQVPQ